jgi:hypothetical protein
MSTDFRMHVEVPADAKLKDVALLFAAMHRTGVRSE